ncbi:unnamed protein product [Scytosiphon promiscuus]
MPNGRLRSCFSLLRAPYTRRVFVELGWASGEAAYGSEIPIEYCAHSRCCSKRIPAHYGMRIHVVPPVLRAVDRGRTIKKCPRVVRFSRCSPSAPRISKGTWDRDPIFPSTMTRLLTDYSSLGISHPTFQKNMCSVPPPPARRPR